MPSTQINGSDIKTPFNTDIILGTGIDIFMMQSGTSNIGTAAAPLNAVYANNIFGSGLHGLFVHITGDTMTGSLVLSTGANLIAAQSGNNVGQPSFLFANGYFANMNATNVFTPVSGGGNIGSASSPYNVIYTNMISGSFVDEYVNVTGDSMTGRLFTPTLATNIATGVTAVFTNITGSTLITGTTVKGQAIEAGILTANSIEAKLGQAINVSGIYGSVDVWSNGTINLRSNVLITGSSTPGGANLVLLGSGANFSFSGFGGNISLGEDTYILATSGTGGIGNGSGINFHGGTNVLGNAIKHAYIHNVIATNITGTYITGTTGYFGNLTIGNAPYVALTGDTMTGSLRLTPGNALIMNNINLGSGNSVTGTDSIVIGINASVIANNSTSVGLYNVVSGNVATAVGLQTRAIGDASLTVGYNDEAYGAQSTAVGYDNIASGSTSTAVGYSNFASGNDSSAIGSLNTAFGIDSVAVGNSNVASGNESLVFGNNSVALGFQTSVVGNIVTGTLGGALYLGAPSGLIIQTGKHVVPEASGTQNLGSEAQPFNIIYANSIISTGSAGDFVNITGDTMTGNLNLAFNAGITASNNLTLTATSTASGNMALTSTSGISLATTLGDITLNTPRKISVTGTTSIYMSAGSGPIDLLAGPSGINVIAAGRIAVGGAGSSIAVANNLIELAGTSGEYLVMEGSNVYLALGGSGNRNWVGTNTATNFIKPVTFSGNVTPVAFMSGSTSIGSASVPFGNVYAKHFIDTLTTVTGLTFTMTTGNSVVLVNSTGTALVSLPIFESGYTVTFKDKSGAADMGTRKITISGVSCTLDGSSLYDINSNYGRLKFVSDGSNWFRID